MFVIRIKFSNENLRISFLLQRKIEMENISLLMAQVSFYRIVPLLMDETLHTPADVVKGTSL